MDEFPRTTVGGVSVSRMIIGTNWFLGYSHTSAAKDRFIKSYQTSKNIADILEVFFRSGIDTIMGMPEPILRDAIADAQDRAGRQAILVLTPHFNYLPGGPEEMEPDRVFDNCKRLGATFCFPHQCVTDCLLDKMHGGDAEPKAVPTFDVNKGVKEGCRVGPAGHGNNDQIAGRDHAVPLDRTLHLLQEGGQLILRRGGLGTFAGIRG